MLDAFWAQADRLEVELPTTDPVSGAAFCTARRKLQPELIQELVLEAARAFDEEFGESSRWRGRRLLAVDGCRINVQRGLKLRSAYGVPTGAHCPQLLASVLFDVVARVPVDVGVAPCFGSERKLLTSHLDVLRSGDVLILDRGYPSYEIVRKICNSPADFVLRLPVSHTFPFVAEFVRSGALEQRIELALPGERPGHQEQQVVSLRVIRLEGPDDVPMILLTSLTDSAASREDLKDLYKMRWEVETFFGLTKSDYLGQGQSWTFEAKTNIPNTEAQILFSGMTDLPPDLQIVLVDEKLNVTKDLRREQSYSFPTGTFGTTKILKVIIGRSEYVSDEISGSIFIPTTFELDQNFPNPFNPATSIRYGLPQAAEVTVKIFDLLGKEVVTLLSGEQKGAGYHVLSWTGRDKNGASVASGLYFYQIVSGKFIQTRKMILVK